MAKYSPTGPDDSDHELAVNLNPNLLNFFEDIEIGRSRFFRLRAGIINNQPILVNGTVTFANEIFELEQIN